MAEFFGTIIGAVLIILLMSPMALIIYMLSVNKIDVDHDGKSDIWLDNSFSCPPVIWGQNLPYVKFKQAPENVRLNTQTN